MRWAVSSGVGLWAMISLVVGETERGSWVKTSIAGEEVGGLLVLRLLVVVG